uniref:DLEC1 cilia and flagella associated protein n=1 Tax=Salvator merianae TaxID=96440 RepID=A0A8D0DPN9_SALMN
MLPSRESALEIMASQSPEPAMYRHRPASELTQDISHLLSSIFKDMYTSEVIAANTVENMIKSRGGDNLHHEQFVEELSKVHEEYKKRLTEAEMLERHIIQARARAAAEEERILNVYKEEVPQGYHHIALPPVKSTFRWCVEEQLLKDHNLICPDDYITDLAPITRAPKGNFQREPKSSASDTSHKTKKSVLKVLPHALQKSLWKNEMTKEERQKDRVYLQRLEDRHNFLKNPRFFPPNSDYGGKSLILPQKRVERMIRGIKKTSVPVFLANPPAVVFSFYEVGQAYERVCCVCGTTSQKKALLNLPGRFPGDGGLVAPGMSCYHIVQFIPEYLADYEDYILVESQAPYPLLVPLKARRPAPALTLPPILDCGACLVGGVKFMEYQCKNEGPSTGKFCIMPKDMWPPPHFRAVAIFGFVEQEPFGIRPAVFELAPGQSTIVEQLSSTLVIMDVRVHLSLGLGQLISLELVSVTGGESSPLPGELTDVTAQHLIRFAPLNPYSSDEKILVLRNLTHVELPFFWQIMKPNLQPLTLDGSVDLTKIQYHQERESAFSIIPAVGILHPHTCLAFVLIFHPKKLKEYHSVLQIVPKNPKQYENGESHQEDVIALEIDIKGKAEPYCLLLEPYAIIIAEENYIGINIRRTFKMHNNSKAPIKFKWGKISDCDIVEVEPCTGKIGTNEFVEFEFIITGGEPGHSCHDLPCEISHSEEPVVLHVEADFKGPLLSIGIASLDLGLIKLGKKAMCTFEIENLSPLPGRWKIQESPACIAGRNEESSPFTVKPASGELCPLGRCTVTVLFASYICQSLQTVLEMEVENGIGSHIPVFVEVQTPSACLLSSHLHFDLSLGIPSEATVHLFNQTLLPVRFQWGKLFGSQASSCVVSISPESGTLGPNEEKELCVEIATYIKDSLSDLTLSCSIEDMLDPLFLAISADVKGLHVTYSEENQDLSEDLKLDFGSEVPLKSVIKRQLVITNHSELAALYSLEVDYFRQPSIEKALEKTRQVTRFIEERKQSAFRASMLSHGKGATFQVQPSAGTLQAFQQLVVEITAYNNMWGHYRDTLICEVSGAFSGGQLWPVVALCFVFFPFLNSDIRMDWESYNQDKDDDKLVDLLVFYGAPFPLKDLDGNEINILWEAEEPSDYLSSNSEDSEGGSSDSEVTWRPLTFKKIISVVIRPHEGVPSDYPFCITPKQVVIPAGGSAVIHISFTPLTLPEIINKFECEGFALGFMSLDEPVRVRIRAGFDFPLQLYFILTSFFYPIFFLYSFLSESSTTINMKLTNNAETPLSFKFILAMPFSVSGIDPKKSQKSSPKDKDKDKGGNDLLLYTLENMLVKVSFHTSLELLTYQHLPEDQSFPGLQVLQFENGDKILEFKQDLVIEYSNKATQVLPMTAYLTVPVLAISCDTIDFETCLVNQTRTESILVMNKSSCKSYWAALLEPEVFSISPNNGVLDARKDDVPVKVPLLVRFMPREDVAYETIITIVGMLGEKPCLLCVRGRGSYDEKYEERLKT